MKNIEKNKWLLLYSKNEFSLKKLNTKYTLFYLQNIPILLYEISLFLIKQLFIMYSQSKYGIIFDCDGTILDTETL